MSAKTVTTRVFTCDQCKQSETFPNDAEAGRCGWVIVVVTPSIKEHALCQMDAARLRNFLAGITVNRPPLGTEQISRAEREATRDSITADLTNNRL